MLLASRWCVGRRPRLLVLVCCVLGVLHVPSVAASPVSLADPDWSWSFDRTRYSVEPTDSIVVKGTVFNAPTSSVDLLIDGVGASFGGDLQKTYRFTFGPTGNSSEFSLQFLGQHILPDTAFPFVFGILTPRGGAAPLGTYPADPAFIGFQLAGIGYEIRYATNTFDVVVPDASLPGLVAIGLGAVLRRRYPMIRR